MRPALERRARIIERQPLTVRRRSARVLSRVAVLLAFDVIALAVARSVSQLLLEPVSFGTRPDDSIAGPLAPPGSPGSLVFGVVLLSVLLISGSYARHRPDVVAFRLIVAAAVATAATAVALASLVGVREALVHTGSFGLICVAVIAAGRLLGEYFVARVWPRARGALPAVRVTLEGTAKETRPSFWGDYAVVDEIHVPSQQGSRGVTDTLRRLHDISPRGVEAIVITEDVSDELLAALAEAALDMGIRVIFPARAVKIGGVHPRLIWHESQPFLEISTAALRTSALFTKRTFDGLGATLLLLVAAPVMAAIALAIKLGSPGPVFFSQQRAGLGGVPFRMLKFRTMRVGAEEEKQELAHLNRSGDARLFKIPDDPRVTAVGRWLRRWSLDELPQLINVLKGDMSLVGPRPFFESDFAEYEDRHFRRLDTKPGITGLWQVSGRSEVVDFEDVVFLDRQYIEQWSLWLDLSILLRTIAAVARRTGAY